MLHSKISQPEFSLKYLSARLECEYLEFAATVKTFLFKMILLIYFWLNYTLFTEIFQYIYVRLVNLYKIFKKLCEKIHLKFSENSVIMLTDKN